MKKLATFFSIAGFSIQYVLPIVLFGELVPYTKEGFGRCLTGMGYVAVALILFFASKKFKEWVLQKPKSLSRGLLLSIFPIVWWAAILIGLNFLGTVVMELATYWSAVIIFIVLGRGCYVVSETLSEGDKK